MSDAPVRTEVLTDDGWLEFQDYFVRRHQEPTVRDIRFRGIEDARATPEVEAALGAASAIVIGPSNPFVSVRPILDVAGVAAGVQAARGRGAPVVAVSGIVGGKALKGPADRMLVSLGHESSALGVARQYAGLADVFVLDQLDAPLEASIRELGMRTLVTDTIMAGDAGRARLAGEILAGRPRRLIRADADTMTAWSPPRAPIFRERGRSSRSAALETAKTRLGGDLDAEERRDLVVDLLRRTLVATRDARRIAGTIVVTMDPAAAGMARDHRAIGLVERAPGLNEAITAARSVAVARGATRGARPSGGPAGGQRAGSRRPRGSRGRR